MSSLSTDSFVIARKRMINDQVIGRGISDSKVIEIMSRIRRHDFVDDALASQAYTDAPLNIGEGQTISQPFIVAFMCEALKLTGAEKILEIGTGCGYQTIVLAMAARQVYTIERFKSLALGARGRFKRYQVRNIIMRVGDGSHGWADAAPFDCILSSCACPEVPQTLVDQLAVGGTLIVPCTQKNHDQQLLRVKKTPQGLKTEDLGECLFVKMVGQYGYKK